MSTVDFCPLSIGSVFGGKRGGKRGGKDTTVGGGDVMAMFTMYLFSCLHENIK